MTTPMRPLHSPHLPLLLFAVALSSCSTLPNDPASPTKDHAYIHYWPGKTKDKGNPGNNSLRLAVKDLIDVKGVVTTAGSEYFANNNAPATRDAKCLELARERNVQIVGKTNLRELAVGVAGLNTFYGTPVNRLKTRSKFIPGGSSSGSAVAITDGSADVALGTDTAGSVRVPAACCGIYGLKTTFGLVPLKGVFPLSPEHTDTVGPLAKNIPNLVKGMDLLQRGFASKYAAVVASHPTARNIRIGRLYLEGTDPAVDKAIDRELGATGFHVVYLNDNFRKIWDQAEKDGATVVVTDVWRNCKQYADKPGISTVTKLIIGHGEVNYPNAYLEALNRKPQWLRALRAAFREVDYIAVPTLQNAPPKFPFFVRSVLLETQVLALQNTEAVSLAGNPALAVPIPLRDQTAPVTSLQLVGPPRSEAGLLNVGRLIEANRLRPQSKRS